MSGKYIYDHRSPRHKKKHLINIFVFSAIFVLIIFGSIYYKLISNTKKAAPISGPSQTVGTVLPTTQSQTITYTEKDYTVDIPSTWKLVPPTSSTVPGSITWHSQGIHTDNRWITIYTDNIPTNIAFNRLLPLTTNGTGLIYGLISDDCANFSNGSLTQVAPAKWQGINFLCNLPNRYDDQVGTGSIGQVNSVTLTGPLNGKHNYFFLYTDRSAEPQYTYLYSIISGFTAT